jgi:hypothetical protein
MKMSAKSRTSLETLETYLPSFTGLVLVFAAYTAAVFTSESAEVATKLPATNQSQSFKVAKKLSAEKLSTLTVLPTRDVASPLDTE